MDEGPGRVAAGRIPAMENGTYLHNPRCSKSREALALLQSRGVQPQVVLYLETPLDAAAITELLAALGVAARDLLRRGEEEFAQLGLDDSALGEDALIQAMATHPRLIERPVYVRGGRAVIGRPPERVLELV